MDENIRFINVIDELKAKGVIADYVQVAANLQTNKAGISDIKAGRKKLSIDLLRRMKLSYPNVNIEWVIMGEGEMFHTDTLASNKPQMPELSSLLALIREKEEIIREQDREIGRLEERIRQMTIEKEKHASDAPISGTANVG